MEYARSAYAAIEMNGSIYVAGGDGQFDNQSVTLNSVECFNIQNNKWTTCAPMNRGRKNFALVASDGLIYAMGGTDASVECYDPDIDVWKMVNRIEFKPKSIYLLLWIYNVPFSDWFISPWRENHLRH